MLGRRPLRAPSVSHLHVLRARSLVRRLVGVRQLGIALRERERACSSSLFSRECERSTIRELAPIDACVKRLVSGDQSSEVIAGGDAMVSTRRGLP
jgi:hypothetical protein